MGRLSGKRAIITGATGGIGGATARAFLAEGASLLLVARTESKLEELAAALDGGDRVACCAADIADEADTQRYVATAVEHFGGVDILFANAGSEGAIQPLLQMAAEDFDAVQRVNVRGSWLAMKYSVPHMPASGGSIVVTSSVAGKVGVPGLGAYAASKHALVGLVEVAALELAACGVRVNAIAPAPVDNAMMRNIEKQAAPDAPEQAQAGFESNIAMKRYARNEEVASLVLFLASDEAGFCTGAVYPVDGGFLAA